MTERELDDLALIWTQEEPGTETEQLVQRLARRVGWQAMLLRYADAGAAVAIALGVGLLVMIEGANLTAVGGLLLVGGIAWITWKRQALWSYELSLQAEDRATLLATAAETTRARLRRTNVSFLAIVPMFLLAVWFGDRFEGSRREGGESVALLASDPLQAIALLAIIGGLLAFLLRSRGRLLAELKRIDELAGEYAREARQDISG